MAAEARIWGDEAEKMVLKIPPDWSYHRKLRHNVIMHTADIDAILSRIEPDMKALELGCASGWLTLAMAERGADAMGLDISEQSLAVARAYYESVRSSIAGTLTYRIADLNYIELESNTYDVIVVKASLHHLIRLEYIIETVHRALKPGGLFWIADTSGDEAPLTVLIAGLLCLFLPTATSYQDKIQALFKFGLHAPTRVKASIQAEGLSPFEGAGRDHDWVELIKQKFSVEQRIDMPAFTGYVTAQLKAPDWFALPFLKMLHLVDAGLVRLKLLRNTGVILYARK